MIEILVIIVGYILWVWRKKEPTNSSCNLPEPEVQKVQIEHSKKSDVIYQKEEVDDLFLLLSERDDDDCG